MAKVGDIVPQNRTGNAKVEVPDDIYNATITKITNFLEDESGFFIADNAPAEKRSLGKRKVRVYVTLDGMEDNTGQDIELSRKFGAVIKGSQGPTLFGKFLQTMTGVPAGDDAQKQIDTDHLVGKKCRIKTLFNAEKGYTNIDGFAPPARQAGTPQARPQAAPTNAPSGDGGDEDAMIGLTTTRKFSPKPSAGGFTDDDFSGYDRR